MALSSAQKSTILDDIALKQEQLAKANSTLTEILNSTIEEYSFDNAEGKQRTKEKSIEKLQMAIEHLERTINSLLAKLRGAGVTNLVLRRKRFRPSYYRPI